MTEQLTLPLDLPECICMYFRDYHTGQRSVSWRRDCKVHQIYLTNFEFRMKMFYPETPEDPLVED